MTSTSIRPFLTDLLRSFNRAPLAGPAAEFERLAAMVWNDGEPPDPAHVVVPALMDSLNEADETRMGHLVLLLGLLAEADAEDALRAGLGRFLDLARRSSPGEPLHAALLYLLSHFPTDRDRVLAALAGQRLDPGDRSRLERALQSLNLDWPDLGRVWPSPLVWRPAGTDRRSRPAQPLGPEQIRALWDSDTRTVLAYTGAKAYWMLRGGTVATQTAVEEEDLAGRDPLHADADLFRPHHGAFGCPVCYGVLQFTPSRGSCPACGIAYPIAHGILDLFAGVPGAAEVSDAELTADLLRRMSEMPNMGLFYEAVLRPAFLQVAGTNWANAVTPGDEDDYLTAHLRPAAGPVLDLACGTGRWTRPLTQAVGRERVIALDSGLPMLNVLRSRLPETAAVAADALDLPFGDATLGAVSCWNSLQAFSDSAAQVIAEVGRCLRPGGTFTLMTFRCAEDRIDRYFQSRHSFPGRAEGIRLFEPHDLIQWLEEAGMTPDEVSGPGSFVFITAERRLQL